MTPRKWNCQLSTVVDAAKRLHGALIDPDYAAPMADRLNAETDTATNNFATRFLAKIGKVTGGGTAQAAKTGDAGQLTQAQLDAFNEMERLTNGARRSARLAFPGQTVLLHSEFQVGVDEPKTLEAEVERAGIILTSTRKYAKELKAKGWTAGDATDLETVIGLLDGKNLEQEAALDDRVGLTDEKIVAANDLYADALAIQNAARLQHPASKPGNETARRRFLLDEFPPRDRSQPDGGTGIPPAGPTTPPKG